MSEKGDARYHVRRREFLNEDPELPAYVIGIVEDTRDVPDECEYCWKRAYIILELGDDLDRVSFDFEMTDARARANSLSKINVIAEVVNAVRDAIEIEVESRNLRALRQDESIQTGYAN